MKQHKRKQNGFSWLPMDKRTDKLGLPLPPRKPELRKPLLWLKPERSELFDSGSALYLINLTDESLEHVRSSMGGCQTVNDGDDVCCISDTVGYYYKNVLPNEAVKVEEYDGVYDLDYVLQVCIEVESNKLGKIEFFSTKKGGVGETVLLWASGECGKGVNRMRNGSLC